MVGANTFRAFHNTPRRPSEVFREWALEALIGRLLMKGVCGVPEIPKATYDRLVWFLHVPLDSYSIQAVRNCIDARLQEQIGHSVIGGNGICEDTRDIRRSSRGDPAAGRKGESSADCA